MSTVLSILTNLHNCNEAGITFFENGKAEEVKYGELVSTTPATAGKLRAAGVKAGQHVVFQITKNRPLIEMFWACIWLGAIPVIAPPAFSAVDAERVNKTIAMLPDAFVIADERPMPCLPKEKAILVDEIKAMMAEPIASAYEPNDDTIRLIQMSSGSTGDPKGILVSEKTLSNAMQATIPSHPQRFKNSMLTWLPLTHNYSLLGFHVYAMFRKFPQILMPTSDFIMNPLLWFEAVTTYRPTVTVSPNFGFIHVLRYLKARGIPDGAKYDFSSVQKLISASEPVGIKTAEEFAEKMADFGLRENAIVVAYGMTESCLQISTTGIYEPLQTVNLDRSNVKIGARYVDIARTDGAAFVSVGKPVTGMSLSIRDNDGDELDDDVVGEIFIAGTSMTRYSITSSGLLEHNFAKDGYMPTGDIGLVHNDNLFVVARKKDIIFVNGKNYYSPDLETIIMEELGQDNVVLGRTNPSTDEEEVVVFVPESPDAPDDRKIIGALASKAGVPVSQVVRIPEIPRSANGKKLRRELEELL